MPCSEKGSVTRRSATLSTMLTSFFRRSPTFACITCTVGLMGVGSAHTCVCVCVCVWEGIYPSSPFILPALPHMPLLWSSCQPPPAEEVDMGRQGVF